MTLSGFDTDALFRTGIGMDEATTARIFEPFFTTKEPGSGTGLGLATVFGIVIQSGGQVFVDSARGLGTSMNVYLPHCRSPAEHQCGAPSSPAAGRARGAAAPAVPAMILLVEDEATVRSAVRRILERSGYEVLEARHGGDALLVAGQDGRPIDFRRGLSNRAVAFVSKPFTASGLLSTVRTALAGD